MSKSVKSIAAALLAVMFVFTLTACGGSSSSSSEAEPALGDTMSLEAMMEDILTDAGELPAVGNIEVNDENFGMYFFIEPVEGAEALVSEAMMSAVAHSVCLLRLPEGSDAAAVAEEIKTNADPRKWICVEAEKVEVTTHSNTILLVMSASATTDAITANFNELYA